MNYLVQMIGRMRNWWQAQTGEEETPFDGDAPAWMISMIIHMVGLLLVAFISIIPPEPDIVLTIQAPDEVEVEELELPEKFAYSDEPTEFIGANSMGGVDVAMAMAPVISDVSEVVPMEVSDQGIVEIAIDDLIEVSTGPNMNANLGIKGMNSGQGVSGAGGAVDRLTYEILLSLEERKTLVVWMFDQSGSLLSQRKEIHDRFDRVYEELGVIQAAEHETFAKHDSKPLLSSVVAFGQQVTERTKAPTDDLAEIKAAVAGIEQDDSGIEMVFQGIHMAADKYKSYRIPAQAGGQPRRNVMLIVFTDEVGDDKAGLETVIKQCQRYAMPVYVVGVPAVFGRRESLVKWVDPDPEYDQTAQWGRVNQGPESLLTERLCLAFSAYDEDEEPIDSGFGPFHLTRLCYETGGIYFAVHPNRTLNGPVSKQETAAFSAHIRHFFDPKVMRRYKPDYVTPGEYKRRLENFPARYALVKAAQLSWQAPMEEPRRKFVRKTEDKLRNEFNEAVVAMQKVLPRIESVYQALVSAETSREKESMPRWKAGYDLAMGRALASKVRADGYRIMLARAATGQGLDPENNHFEIIPAPDVVDDPQLAELTAKSRVYLERVIQEHPDTPWALLARKELDEWLGWEWKEWFVDMTPRPRVVDRGIGRGNGNGGGGNGVGVGVNNNRNNAPRPAAPPPKPKRKPPRL